MNDAAVSTNAVRLVTIITSIILRLIGKFLNTITSSAAQPFRPGAKANFRARYSVSNNDDSSQAHLWFNIHAAHHRILYFITNIRGSRVTLAQGVSVKVLSSACI